MHVLIDVHFPVVLDDPVGLHHCRRVEVVEERVDLLIVYEDKRGVEVKDED